MQTELGRLTFDGDCLSGGGDSEAIAVDNNLDVLRLTEEKARRSRCYVMFMNKSEKVILYLEDPHYNVASYYILTHEVEESLDLQLWWSHIIPYSTLYVTYLPYPSLYFSKQNSEGESCAAQRLLISQHRPFNSGIQCFVRSVEAGLAAAITDNDKVKSPTKFRITISFILTKTGLVDATLDAINQRPHHDAVKALCRELLGLVAAVDEDDAVYSRRDEIDSFYDQIYEYHSNKPPGDFAERVGRLGSFAHFQIGDLYTCSQVELLFSLL